MNENTKKATDKEETNPLTDTEMGEVTGGVKAARILSVDETNGKKAILGINEASPNAILGIKGTNPNAISGVEEDVVVASPSRPRSL